MSTLICDQTFHKTDNSRGRMINALRAALNAAEQGENEVTINYDNLEITWNYEDNEFFVIG
jgi:acetylglutamate kinase